MRRSIGLLALLVALTVVPAAESTSRVVIERNDAWTTASIELPGRLVSYALPSSADGSRAIVVLIQPAAPPTPEADLPNDGDDDEQAERALPPCPDESAPAATLGRPPQALHRLDPHRAGALLPLVAELERRYTAVDAADVDNDGVDEILLARDGAIDVLDNERISTLVEDGDLRWRSLHPRVTHSEDLEGLALAWSVGLGQLRLLGPGPADQPWQARATAELPLQGAVRSDRIRVTGPRPQFVFRAGDGALVFATPPEGSAARRIRVLLARVSPSGESSVVECWGRLPEAEDVLEHAFLEIGGEPHLLVMTKPADKLALFGEKRVRIFPLRPDRTRLGLPPMFAADSRVNLWQATTPNLLDVNGDARDDLVLGYWKGLTGDRVVLDVYLGLAPAGFAPSPINTAFDVKDGDRSFVTFGGDVDGDGQSDLLVRGRGKLYLHRGSGDSKGRKLVSKSPLVLPVRSDHRSGNHEFEISTNGVSESRNAQPHSAPRVLDLDADGRDEVLLVRTDDGDGHGQIQLLKHSGDAPAPR